MNLRFRDPSSVVRETTAVASAAALVGALAPALTTLPVAIVAPASAWFGGALAAALTRKGPSPRSRTVGLGIVGGALAALGHVALSTRFGVGLGGELIGGALGGVALSSLLATDESEDASPTSMIGGLLAGATLGVVGVVAGHSISVYAAAEGATATLTSGVVSGLIGLWVCAAAGVRRVEPAHDPLLRRARKLGVVLVGALAEQLQRAQHAYTQTLQLLSADESIQPALRAQAAQSATHLFEAVLATLDNWLRVSAELGDDKLSDLERRLSELAEKRAATEDEVSLAHLARATQALHAQHAALQGLARAQGRAESALDAQTALLGRLRLAVAQHQASDRERLAWELSEVAEQSERLTDDLDALSSALSEAEATFDRRALAELEVAGRKALDQLSRDMSETEVGERAEVLAAR